MVAGLVSYLRRHHIGVLALFVALSGTAYAATLPRNSVGAPQLKKNAVTSAKVKNRSLLARDFARGQLPAGPRGPQGPVGPRGERGERGLTGPTGAAGATNVTVREGTEESGVSTASCLAGERAVGGGGTATGEDGALWDTAPTQLTGTPTSWDARAIDVTTGTLGDPVVAWVICASP
jgi:hypothetical protein